MDMEPSTSPENPQDEMPPTGPRPTRKGVILAVILVAVLASFGVLLARKIMGGGGKAATVSTSADIRSLAVRVRNTVPMPNVQFVRFLPDADGRHFRREMVTIQDYLGRPSLVHLWATWCPPCREDMQALDRAAGAMAAMGVQVLPVQSADKSGADGIRYFFRGADIARLPFYSDSGKALMESLSAQALPQTFFVDANGMVKGYVVGALPWDSDAVLSFVKDFADTGVLP